MSENSKQPDPIADRIRELRAYDFDDDPDSSVNIHVEQGGVVHVEQRDSEPAKPKWLKRATTIVASLLGIGAVIDMVIQALHK